MSKRSLWLVTAFEAPALGFGTAPLTYSGEDEGGKISVLKSIRLLLIESGK